MTKILGNKSRLLGDFSSNSKFKNNVKKDRSFSEELESELESATPILLDEQEINVVYNIMKQLLDSNKIKISEFETDCKHCGREIMMRNFGFGWRAQNLKNSKPHRCEEGQRAYQKLNRKKFDVDDNC